MTGTLIVGPAWIGDMVMAHTLVQKIRMALPEEPIEMLAPPATAGIAERMAEVSQVHVLETDHGELGLGKRFRMGRLLAKKKFSRSYVLPNSWKSALVPYFAGIARRTGWRGEARYLLLNDSAPLPAADLPLMIERFMGLQDIGEELRLPYPQPRLELDTDRQEQLLAEHDLHSANLSVALCPGAEFGQAKRWPEESFAAVAAWVLKQKGEVWLLGGPADREVCTRIVHSLGVLGSPVRNLAGKTSLSDAVDLLGAASAVVCNDSGLMHIACAVDTPVVALYGSTSPGFTPPLHAQAKALSLVDLDNGALKLDCQPCFERTCRFDHGDCLAKLSPTYVIERLQALSLAKEEHTL